MRIGLLCLAVPLSACGSDGELDRSANRQPADMQTDGAGGNAAQAGPGPRLSVPAEQLAQALTCRDDLTGIDRDPVLLTPAFSTDEESFGWNYLRQLPVEGIAACSLTIPDHGFGDLQNAAEYVVHAVRWMHQQSGRKVILFGHQHGPLDELWALMFWPDLPGKVSSLISLATPYQGTANAGFLCNSTGNCPPSVWQIAEGSNFLAALNSRVLPAGPAYTSITTLFDELIIPQPEVSQRDGATNIVPQDVCPGRPVDHFSILADNLAYQLVLDGINHPGQPANPDNLAADICTAAPFMPEARNPETLPPALQGVAGFLSGFGGEVLLGSVSSEPVLREYAKRP